MDNKQIRFGVILQYVQMGLSIIIQLIYTPLMLKVLGKSEYGIYNLAISIISYLSLLSLGFGASYLRFYSKYKADNDTEGISKLNALYLSVFFVIGLISLIAGLLLSFHVDIFFNETYTENDLNIAHYLMIFLAINLAISFPASVFTSYITSQEKFIFQKLVMMGKTILSPSLSIALLFSGYGSIGLVVVTTVVSLTVDTIYILYCLIKLKMKFKFGKPNWFLLKEIFVFSIFIAINQIIDQINWQTDKIILGKIINSTAVAIYAISATINTMYISFSTAISSPFAPRINRIAAESIDINERNFKFTEIFISVGKMQFVVMLLILTGFIFFGKYFISIWAGDDYYLSYYAILLLICPVTIPLIQNTGIEIQRAVNKHQFRSVVYLIMAVLNVGISIFLCYYFNKIGNDIGIENFSVIGVALGTTISLLIANGLIMNIYYYKVIGINVIIFWKSIFRLSFGLIVPVLIGVFIINLKYDNIIMYLLLILIYTVVYLFSMFFIGLDKQTRRSFINRTFIRKKKALIKKEDNE